MENRICKAFTLREYQDRSFLLEEYCGHGTLLDYVNAQKQAKAFNEVTVAFYTLEILSILLTIHNCGVIHGDIKPDNFLLMNDGELEGEWNAKGSASGWNKRGLKLIDFGRAIDLELYVQGAKQQFSGDNHAKEFQCIEMVQKKVWSFQIDFYGVCGVIHCLLFHSFMQVAKKRLRSVSGEKYMPKSAFKRYWSFDWETLFVDFLNIPDEHSNHPDYYSQLLCKQICLLQQFLATNASKVTM